MNTWFYGYADNSGLAILKEDTETIAVELFYDTPVKKEISDDKKKDLWSYSNRAHKEKDKSGVVFQIYFPDSHKDELLTLKETDPKAALNLIHLHAIHIDLGSHGTTIQVAEEKWKFICGLIPEPVTAE